jgi:hypothetical protein
VGEQAVAGWRLAALVAAGALVVALPAWSRLGAGTGPDALPPVPADAQDGRVLPRVVTLATGPYAFIDTHPDGTPVVPDPCRPMHWTMNPAGMPDGGEELVREAVREVSAATGLAFVEDAPTTETVVRGRPGVQQERYGDRWAPVLVAVTDDATMAALGGDVAAVAEPTTVTPSGPGSARVVGGQVAIDADFVADSVRSPSGRARFRMVVLHELGHVVGLDHVEDPTQVMHGRTGYLYLGSGDRQGLALAGSGRCFTDT